MSNFPLSIRTASCSAFSSSTTSSNCWIRPTTSPVPEDPAGHAVGAELLEPVRRLAHTDELDRLARDRPDRQRGAAARVAVQLGQDDAVEVQALVERLRGADRVLADHRVDDQQDVRRGARARLISDSSCISGSSMARRPAVSNRMTSRPRSAANCTARSQMSGRLAARIGEHGDVQLLAEDLELIDGGRTVDVGRDQQRALVLLLEEAGQLADGGRLARALQADQHDAGRALLRELDARCRPAPSARPARRDTA